MTTASASTPTPPVQTEPRDWLVWSFEHRGWWAPNSRGYTTNILWAGLYTKSEADDISAVRGDVKKEEPRHILAALQAERERTPYAANNVLERMTVVALTPEGDREPDDAGTLDYAIALQRIIEAACNHRPIPESAKRAAPHHAEMAARAFSPVSRPDEIPFWISHRVRVARHEVERFDGPAKERHDFHVIAELSDRLASREREIEELRKQKDGAYSERQKLVYLLARIARHAGWRVGIKRTEIEGWDPAWHNWVYIDGPTGQLSWHYHDSETHLFEEHPPYEGEWDDHTTEEKYYRVLALSGDSLLGPMVGRLRGEVHMLTTDRERLEKELAKLQEAEASVCPEDVGFVEYIKALQKEALDALIDAADLKSQLAAAQEDSRKLQNRIDHIRSAGHQLANCAYNLLHLHSVRMEDRERVVLKRCQEDWDNAISVKSMVTPQNTHSSTEEQPDVTVKPPVVTVTPSSAEGQHV